MSDIKTPVLIIGAGPAGSCAAALLLKKGIKAIVLEKQKFPRFSIGESLLPQCLGLLEEAGLLEQVKAGGFQYKNGAAFERGGKMSVFDFGKQFSKGYGHAYQVQRGKFDKLLADSAGELGADIRYEWEITSVIPGSENCTVEAVDPQGNTVTITADFVLDASGFGRVLPRLLNLEKPSDFPVRESVFTHVEDNFDPSTFDREKILVTIDPEADQHWYWAIPFSGGRCSIGAVIPADEKLHQGLEPAQRLKKLVAGVPNLSRLLKNAKFDTPVRSIHGYSANVTDLWGARFALLGNAAEFLDPVFSSGVTIALKSASLAVDCLSRQMRGEKVDWENDYARELMVGVNTFRRFVNSWYKGGLHDIFFYENPDDRHQRMICSILSGYAWDTENPFVSSERKLAAMENLCASTH